MCHPPAANDSISSISASPHHCSLFCCLLCLRLRLQFAGCVARRACRPVTGCRPQFKWCQGKQRYVSTRPSSLSGRRNPTSTYGMPLPPFGLEASNTEWKADGSTTDPYLTLSFSISLQILTSPPYPIDDGFVAGPEIRTYITLALNAGVQAQHQRQGKD
jgi:hypothetical protein